LHKAWSAWLGKEKYSPFKSALDAAIKKNHEKIADSDAFILTDDSVLAVLDLRQNMCPFKKHWSEKKNKLTITLSSWYVLVFKYRSSADLKG